jgi:hypothetical protein
MHHQHMSKIFARRPPQAIQHRGAFAAIGGPADDRHVQSGKRRAAVIGTAVDHHPDGMPKVPHLPRRFQQLCTAIITRDQNQMLHGSCFGNAAKRHATGLEQAVAARPRGRGGWNC